MFIISNSQRDLILRVIDTLCGEVKGEDNRTYNIKRMARRFAKTLRGKQPVNGSELTADNNQNQQ